MMRKPPKYVKGYIDRHGTPRFYYRRRGFKAVPLPGLPWSPEFMAAYEAAGQGVEPVARKREKPGSVSALVASYYQSAEYARLAPITQRTYRSTIEPFREQYGERSAATLERKHVKGILAKMADRPVVANNWLKTIRILMRHAVDLDWRSDDPTHGIKKMRTGSTGYRAWSEDAIEKFYAHHPEGSKARLALDMLLHTAQRRADVVGMGWQHVRDGVLTIRQSKTRAEVQIPLHPDLVAALEAVPRGQLTFLLTEYGKPFSAAGFGNWFRDRVQEVGLDGLAAHGLRKAACRRLAEANCTAPQIMSISGHRNLREVQTYIDDANRLGLAREAIRLSIAAHEKRTKSV